MTASLSASRLALLGALTALGSLGTQMFIPAMPAAAAELRMDASTMQWAISVYLAGIGMGQLGWGPISDSIGRRPVLLIGAALFAGGSLAAGAASGPGVLLGGRVVQALGGAAALIAARALVAETASRGREMSSLAALSSITLISPTLAPTLGGLIALLLGWRAIFWVLAGAAVAASLLLRLFYPPEGARPATMRNLRAEYRTLLRQPAFQLFTLGNALVSTGLYLFLSASPFLLQRVHGLSALEAGLCYCAVAGATILGTICVRPLERWRRDDVLPAACAVIGAAAVLLVAIGAAGWRSLPLFLVGMALYALGGGIGGPAALGGALRVGAAARGSASSIFGAAQMLISAIVSAVLARVIAPRAANALPLAMASLAVLAVITLLAARHAARGNMAGQSDDPTTDRDLIREGRTDV